MNIFLAAFLGCLLALAFGLSALRLYSNWLMRRISRIRRGGPLPMQSIEYPKIDPDDVRTVMIGEMLDNHQIALRKACGCKLCMPFVRLTMPSPCISEQPLAPPTQGQP